MPKCLIEASYTLEGTRGLMKSGGTARREAVRQAVESVGGRFEVQYFALGEHDVSSSRICQTMCPLPPSRSR
jgi:uncharacterized protein with GYD domain